MGNALSDAIGFDARFHTLYEETYSVIRDYCLRRLDPEDAADATAEIFTVAWRRIDSMPTGDEARLWLYGVARNVIAHQRRGHERRNRLSKRLKTTSLTSVAPAADVQVVRRSEEERVLQALERLKPDDREVLRLKLWEDLSHGEIGDVFGISAHAVDMRVKRATKRLGSLLARSPRTGHRPNAEGGVA